MKLVDLPDESFFYVPHSRRLKGLFFKLYFNDDQNVVVCDKAPYFDKTFWFDPLLEVKDIEKGVVFRDS